MVTVTQETEYEGTIKETLILRTPNITFRIPTTHAHVGEAREDYQCRWSQLWEDINHLSDLQALVQESSKTCSGGVDDVDNKFREKLTGMAHEQFTLVGEEICSAEKASGGGVDDIESTTTWRQEMVKVRDKLKAMVDERYAIVKAIDDWEYNRGL
ncbi:MAG: hypothetical protein Q9210_003518 [Variospora velana]